MTSIYNTQVVNALDSNYQFKVNTCTSFHLINRTLHICFYMIMYRKFQEIFRNIKR